MEKKFNKDLTAEQKLVLFEEGTEAPGTSELNHEKREGSYHCTNCGEKLFDSIAKYESGSGWPSFYQSLPDKFETITDTLLGYERVEYHCKKCGGHHGHILEDGPNPTGKRYCNNGVYVTLKPKEQFNSILKVLEAFFLFQELLFHRSPQYAGHQRKIEG